MIPAAPLLACTSPGSRLCYSPVFMRSAILLYSFVRPGFSEARDSLEWQPSSIITQTGTRWSVSTAPLSSIIATPPSVLHDAPDQDDDHRAARRPPAPLRPRQPSLRHHSRPGRRQQRGRLPGRADGQPGCSRQAAETKLQKTISNVPENEEKVVNAIY